ncbi:hypothetical protein OG930_45025 [Streptomyces sp. NBC_01799]|uniref:hypothetical protein n=1 Tax=Streptomyces sp. NBC_01800 TaxID=2975945 RepID=UPI002DD8799E|nr:hypothetical protein [Streptomyces sp. NBC_01800]WSA65631.1 hypothetical protein OIE65_00435 [Streptomyces sp. NBC_01800]WSA73486.1 hypothetical protein OIE65_45625 [Streptomyces sp. NBC_01800]WSA74245.1 hypothetical protein OG930_00435 [Streptomyces sp. NBC_01799]WSA82002.1 hypothetical protein OG930_45025 [Streptomyces sp. NBC_01799]
MEPTAFPQNLVQAQRDWIRTYEALAQPHPHRNTVLRRRLLELSAQIWWHPFFTTGAGRAPTAREELRRLARERGQGTARAS